MFLYLKRASGRYSWVLFFFFIYSEKPLSSNGSHQTIDVQWVLDNDLVVTDVVV